MYKKFCTKGLKIFRGTLRKLTLILYYRALLHTFKPKLEKIKKVPSRKNFLHLKKWNFLAPRLKNFYFQEGTLIKVQA